MTTFHLSLPIAYLDGGTGSLILQAALAGIVTSAYFVKTKWRMLRAMLQRKGNPPSDG